MTTYTTPASISPLLPESISSKEDYRLYINEIERLIDLDPDQDTPEGQRLAHLVDVVLQYESEQGYGSYEARGECG